MDKGRIETLSDSVFAIVMTLLVLDIKVHSEVTTSDSALFTELTRLVPLFAGYIVSLAVLAMYWIGHHSLFYYFAKTANRTVAYMNLAFLGFVSLIPFSSYLLGTHNGSQLAILVYGANIIFAGLALYIMFAYVLASHEIENGTLSIKLIKQASIRILLPPFFAAIGIAVSFYSIRLSLLLFALPIFFNIIPRSLYIAERLVGYEPKD